MNIKRQIRIFQKSDDNFVQTLANNGYFVPIIVQIDNILLKIVLQLLDFDLE